MTYMLDGVVPVDIDEEDVEIAKMYIKDNTPTTELWKMFLGSTGSHSKAVCIVAQAKKELGLREF